MNDNYWGVKNNTSLPELNAKSLVRNLKERYHKAYLHKGHEAEGDGGSGIYTWTGTVLLAINPYQRLNVYGDTQVEHHFAKTITQADPHPFGIASHAVQTLNKTKSAQSIVVSGESGAGKTETAKFVMRFLSTIGRSTSGDSLAEFLESTNPILEAFGNSKTCRNENSSRFGKVMKLFYTQTGPTSHKLVSATVETYLLARSRVTHTPQNERNYHVFYLLTNGKVDQHFHALQHLVKPAGEFTYLAASSGVQSGYLSDTDFLKEMLGAFKSLGISESDQVKLFELVLALLWMGNIGIEAEDAKDTNGKCRVSASTSEALKTVAKILGVPTGSEGTENDEPTLEKLLTEQKLSIGQNNKSNSSIWAGTNANKAKTVRDAVVKRIYAKMFDYIVSILNRKLAGRMGASKDAEAENRFISILDIFGFENLPQNGLEQLCINYANERLQNFFLKNVVISEAEEYSRECVPYPGVSPPDNGPVIRAIAGRNGIFDLLRKTTVDSMLRPLEGRDYDTEFYTQMNQAAGTASSTLASGGLVRVAMTGGKGKHNPIACSFTVSHYAEEVLYLAEGFVDSNKDSDSRVDFIVSHFRNPLLQECLATPVPGDILSITSRASETGSGMTSATLPSMAAGTGPTSLATQQRRCIATTFAAQVDHLLEDHLEKTRLHCIRCIKPNDEKKANQFDDDRVGSQLLVSGMNEVLTLMAHSYPIRIPYVDLFSRYRPLLSERILSELTRQSGGAGGVATRATEAKISGAIARLFVVETIGLLDSGTTDTLLDHHSHVELKEGMDFQFGTSKVFFKLGKVDPLEKLMHACDKDKELAHRVAELIGRRIMAKRKSRQLKFMRTSFKLLVIYRRRQAYWKWFHAYFTRLTFLVKACKTHFFPRMKARRIQRRRAVRTIETAFLAYRERKKIAAAELVRAHIMSFVVRGKLATQSRLRNQMGASTELIHGAIATYAARTKLMSLHQMLVEQRKAEALEKLRIEAELLAKFAADREAELQREREEMENLRKLAEEQAAEQRKKAAEKLEETRIENERKLLESNERISQLETECASRVSEIELLKSEFEISTAELSSEMTAAKSASDQQIAALSAELESRLAELENLRSQFETEIVEVRDQQASELKRMEIKMREDSDVFQARIAELSEQLGQKESELESLKSAHEEEIARLQQDSSSDQDRVRIQLREIEDSLRAELDTARNELTERTELYEYWKKQSEEDMLNLRQSHESELDSGKADFAELGRDLNAKINQLIDQLDQNQKMLDRTKTNDQEIIDRLMAQHESELAIAHEDLAKAKYELESRLELVSKQLEDKSAELIAKTEELEDEMEQLKSTHSDDMTFSQIRAKEAEERLALRISELMHEVDNGLQRIEQVTAESQQEICALEESHATELYAAQSKLEAVQAEMQKSIADLLAKLESSGESHAEELERLKYINSTELTERETELRSEFDQQLSQLTATQSMLSSEAATILREKENELAAAVSKYWEFESAITQLKSESDAQITQLRSQMEQEREDAIRRLSAMDAEKSSLIAAESAKVEELTHAIETLRIQQDAQKAGFEQTLSQKDRVHAETLASEKARLDALLATSRSETAAITEQLESVVQEKAKLAVVASQSLMQGEKLKKDAEEQLRRERAEMERKIQNESARLKRDFEIINKRTLEVKLFEVEELKAETQKRLEEAERMRNDAVKMLQEIRRGTYDDEKENGKTIAVLPQDKEEVVQQAIHDYHSASDEYERTYVIERRRNNSKKERDVENAKTNALEAKLQRTSIATKMGEVAEIQKGRKSLGNLTNLKSPPPAGKLDNQPVAKIPRLSSEKLVSRSVNN